MVYFVCENCSETLKRKAAESHFNCRPTRLTCVDCSKTFDGDSFREHTTCVSEEEKYQKSLYKGGSKVKRDPQAEWTASIHKAASSATKHKDLLELLTAYSNVPRKLKPFVNFAKNSLRLYNDRLLEELFNLVQAAAPPRPPAANQPKKEDDEDAAAAPAPAGTKRKRSDASHEEGQETEPSEPKAKVSKTGAEKAAPRDFDMKRFLIEILTKEGKMKTKRLKVRAVGAAVQASSGSLTESSAEAGFDKKLARLMKKKRVVEDSTGKFLQLVTEAADDDDDE